MGYIASFSDALSAAVISSNALLPLHDALANEREDHIRGASAWSLGQIGKHSPVHAKGVAEAGVMPKLLIYALSKSSSDDLQSKCEKSIEVVCKRLTHFPALDSMLQVCVDTFPCTKALKQYLNNESHNNAAHAK